MNEAFSEMDVALPDSGEIDQYRYRDLIQKGGVTSFLRVEDRGGTSLMMQIPNREHIASVVLRKRFVRAVEILKALEGESPPAYRASGAYDVEGGQQVPYIVTDMPFPRALAQIMQGEKTSGRVPDLQRGVHLLRSLAGVLAKVHGLQIVHRNLRPSVIRLDAQDNLQIFDYVFSLGLTEQVTRQGMNIGTARYMAPEQMKGAHDVDGRADLYALGLIVYENVTHANPFGVELENKILEAMRHLQQEPDPPSRVNSAIPAALDTILGNLLRIEPRDRYRTVHHLLEDLQRHFPV